MEIKLDSNKLINRLRYLSSVNNNNCSKVTVQIVDKGLLLGSNWEKINQRVIKDYINENEFEAENNYKNLRTKLGITKVYLNLLSITLSVRYLDMIFVVKYGGNINCIK